MIRTIQEETQTRKEAFEIWSATFGDKINRFHEDNGGFLNNLSEHELRILDRQ